jgi:hypothetical protein
MHGTQDDWISDMLGRLVSDFPDIFVQDLSDVLHSVWNKYSGQMMSAQTLYRIDNDVRHTIYLSHYLGRKLMTEKEMQKSSIMPTLDEWVEAEQRKHIRFVSDVDFPVMIDS